MVDWRKNDGLFFKELKSGFSWQKLPALFLSLHDLNVEMPDLEIRSDISDAPKWINTIDLVVSGLPIEIKSRNEKFFAPDSFPYNTVFVDTVSGFNAKSDKPFAYIMVSRPTGSMFWIPGNGVGEWAVERKFDRIRKIYESFYTAPKSLFHSMDLLVNELKSRRDK